MHSCWMSCSCLRSHKPLEQNTALRFFFDSFLPFWRTLICFHFFSPDVFFPFLIFFFLPFHSLTLPTSAASSVGSLTSKLPFGNHFWGFPTTGIPQMDGLVYNVLVFLIDDCGVPIFQETTIWEFPQIGVPPVLIHVSRIFAYFVTIQLWDTPFVQTTIFIYIYKIMTSHLCHIIFTYYILYPICVKSLKLFALVI